MLQAGLPLKPGEVKKIQTEAFFCWTRKNSKAIRAPYSGVAQR